MRGAKRSADRRLCGLRLFLRSSCGSQVRGSAGLTMTDGLPEGQQGGISLRFCFLGSYPKGAKLLIVSEALAMG